MKHKTFSLFLLMAATWLTSYAQEPVNMKFGKPTKEELQMTAYAQDSTADAVVLCRLTNVNFTIQQQGYLVDYEEKIRIKVLKPEGARVAEMTIPYYKVSSDRVKLKLSKFSLSSSDLSGDFYQAGSAIDNSLGSFDNESVEDLKVVAYNMEGGKTVKTQLSKGDVKKEQLDDQHFQLRFTVPNVKAGTVIECQYTIHSELFYMMHDWYGQCEIPVAYAKLYMDIPCYLIYNMEEHGKEQRLNCKCITGTMNYKLESDPLAAPVNVRTNRYTIVGTNLKGIPQDATLWNSLDNYAGITMELKSFCLPNTNMVDCIKTWEQVDLMLLEDDDLGKQLNSHSPLAKEIEAANMTAIASQRERAEAVCRLVMERVKWNGKYNLWPRSTSETLKEGEGSNADINLLLIQSLKDAGIEAAPVVLRTRDQGSLPYNFPSLQKLTTFVVGIITPGGNCYTDASSAGKLDVLMAPLQADRARLVMKAKKSQWVNLQKQTKGHK